MADFEMLSETMPCFAVCVGCLFLALTESRCILISFCSPLVFLSPYFPGAFYYHDSLASGLKQVALF